MKNLFGVLMGLGAVVLLAAAAIKGATSLPYPINALPVIVIVEALIFSGIFYWALLRGGTEGGGNS